MANSSYVLLLAFKERLCVVFWWFALSSPPLPFIFNLVVWVLGFFFFLLLHLVLQRDLTNSRAVKGRAGKEHLAVSYRSSSCAHRVLSVVVGAGRNGLLRHFVSMLLCSASHQLLRSGIDT